MFELNFEGMTQLQIDTILDFAKGMSTHRLAKKYKCCQATISDRLCRIYKHHQKIFDNALSIRHATQKYRYNLQHPLQLDKHLTRGI